MLKWGFRIATLLSLMLFIGVIAIWIRSYTIRQVVSGSYWTAHTSPNCIWISWTEVPRYRDEPVYREGNRYDYLTLDDIIDVNELALWMTRKFRVLGVGLYARGNGYNVRLPDWFIAAATLILPMFWLYRTVKKRSRFLAGHCTHCGYDLRASPDRCPECGTAV